MYCNERNKTVALTIRENLKEVMTGGNPDRFVNQYEFMNMLWMDPHNKYSGRCNAGQENIVNCWGVTYSFPDGSPGAFPIHTPDKLLIHDITEWKEIVKAPQAIFKSKEWEDAISAAEATDRSNQYVTLPSFPGAFEVLHSMISMEEALVALYEEPECVKDIIKYLMDFEIRYAEEACKYIKPEAIFHHDDWGSQRSTFMSPKMFEEFLFEPYKELYGYWKNNGVELIVHHSDSFAETLVPYMIEMGIDIWQGVMTTNDIPKMIEQYGGKITFMGGINSATIDKPGWTREEVCSEVKRACTEYGTKYYIPNLTQGGAFSTFEGVYDATTEEIKNMSKIIFG